MKKTRKLPGVVTAAFLESLGACRPQLRRFGRMFPDGCRITQTTVVAAIEEGFDVFWFCTQVCDPGLCSGNSGVRRAYWAYRRELRAACNRYWDGEEKAKKVCVGRADQRAAYQEMMAPVTRRRTVAEAKAAVKLLRTLMKGGGK